MSIDKVQERLDRLAQKTYTSPVYRLPGSKYTYVFGFTHAGKPVCLGPFNQGDPEIDRALGRLADGETFEKNTRDVSKASREIRAELLKRGEDVDESLRKHLHKKGFDHNEAKH